MAVDFIPTMGDYQTLQPFRYWCQKVLPLVYDDSLSYYELLCKVVDYLNKTMEDVETLHDDVDALHDAYELLQNYVNDYFDNLDVQTEINNKLDAMATDGTLTTLIEPFLPDIISAWLTEHITPTTPVVDDTLTISEAAADAKVTGDGLKARFNSNIAVIGAGNYASFLPDVDAVNTNTFFRLNFAVGSTSIPAHLPFSSWESKRTAIFESLVAGSGSHNVGDIQLLITSEHIYLRNYLSDAWSVWNQIDTTNLQVFPTIVGGNYATVLADADNITTNTIYRLNYSVGATSIPAHLPMSKWESNTVALLISCVANSGSHTAGDSQLFITSEAVYIRNYTGVWAGWYCVTKPKKYVVDINGGGDYTSLTACIVEAIKYPNSEIRIKKGVYDIKAEYEAKYGATVWENFDYGSQQIKLSNGVKLIGEYGTVLEAEFDTPIDGVSNFFSPIDCLYDCSVENVEIHAKNCRYCIHDDQWDRTQEYKHTFKKLKLYCDNTGNTYWTRRLAFGGGLGVNGIIEFDACYFESEGIGAEAFTGYGLLGYHNSPSHSHCRIDITNCYFAGSGTFRFTYYGQSTADEKSLAFVSGCSLGHAMEIAAELGGTVENVEIIDCNNIIR